MPMKKKIITSLAVLLLGLATTQAQDLKITQIEFATSIENREPLGVDTAFASSVGTIFCFTRIEGASDTTQITHSWYYKEQEKARINLTIKSDDWRTWSSKQIQDSWTGRWRVMIEDDKGNVLATKTFNIE